jgi:hypothetical protein
MQDVKLPTIVVTNYQQYINPDFLTQGIADTIPEEMDAVLPEYLYVSIAYMDIKKARARAEMPVYVTNLVLSIKGVSHSYKLMHSNTDLYLAKAGLDVNQYANQATKDAHIKLMQQAFETLVFMRVDRITEDVIANSINLQ